MASRRTLSLWLLASIAALTCVAAYSQIADSATAVVADIPVNYTEANSGIYTLPDPLKLNNGQPVRDARTWFEKRRPEIRKLIEDNWYGRSPGRPKEMTFDVVEQDTPAFDGKAIRRQITIYFTKERTGPKMDLLIYLPANGKRPVPMFLNMSFSANNLVVADPNVKVGRRWDRQSRTHVAADARPTGGGAAAGTTANRGPRGLRVEQFIADGIGIATFNQDDLAPDFVGSEGLGVKALYLKPGQTKPADDEWGAIAAWAWGASRARDHGRQTYFQDRNESAAGLAQDPARRQVQFLI